MGRKHLYPPSVRHGIPKLGRLPRGWTSTTFGEQLRVVERPIILKDHETYQLVSAKRNRGGIVARETLRGAQILTAGQFQVEAGDFITSNRQIIHGACGVVPRDLAGAVVSGEYTVMHARSGLHLPYFAHYTHGDYFQKSCFYSSVGVDVEKMIFDVDKWLELPFHLPPLSEQRRIATCLEDVEIALNLSRNVTDRLEKIRQLFVSRFVERGTSLRVKLGAKIGISRWRFPKAWPIEALKAVADVSSGVTLGRQIEGHDTVELPYLRVANVQDGHFDLSEVKTVRIRRSEISRFALQPGDVLMNEGGDCDKLGRGAVWRGEILQCLHQNHVFRVRANLSRLQPEFLAFICKSAYGKHFFRSNSKQTTNLASINSSQLKEFLVPLPPLDEQCRIVEHLDHWTFALNAEDLKLTSLERVKSELARRLFTGALRVTR